MSLRADSHLATLDFLGRLERDGVKALSGATATPAGFHGSMGGSGQFGGRGWNLRLPGAGFDYQSAAGDLTRNSAVAICLAWYANNFPEPDFKVVRDKPDGTVEVVVGHPLVKLLRRPNPHYGWHALAKGLVADYRTDGTALWAVFTDAAGVPAELWWMPRESTFPGWYPGEYLSYWDYYPGGGGRVRMPVDRVVQFRDGIDPKNPRLGCCPLKSALREVCTDNEGATYYASVMRNLGIVGYILNPADPEKVFGDEEERRAISDSFVEATTGEKRGRPIVPSAGLKPERVGMTPDEMALDKILGLPEARIVGAMLLNSQVLNLPSGASTKTYANYKEARQAAYQDGLIPMQREIAWVITQRLLPMFPNSEGLRFVFDYSQIQCLQESEDAKFTRYGTAYKDGVATKNEARHGIGLDPVDAGDVYADGSSPTLPETTNVADGTTPATGSAVPADDVQAAALNGAQIASMVSIVEQVVTGQVPLASARAMVAAAFPSLDAAQVAAILDPTEGFEPTPAAAPPVAQTNVDPKNQGEDAATKALTLEVLRKANALMEARP